MVYLHTGPMGVHRACFFIARAGRAATPERNHSGNQPPILCILPLVAHQLASARKNFLALASWCATKGKIHKMEGVFSGEIPIRGSNFPCPIDKKARRMTPIVPVWRHTMRAGNGGAASY